MPAEYKPFRDVMHWVGWAEFLSAHAVPISRGHKGVPTLQKLNMKEIV